MAKQSQNKPNQTQSCPERSRGIYQNNYRPPAGLSAIAGFYEASAKENGEGGFKRQAGVRIEIARGGFFPK
jgi:hypothetical protein